MLLEERNANKDAEELPVLKLTIERSHGRRSLATPLPRPPHVMEETSRRVEQRIGWRLRNHCEPVTKGGLEGMQAKPVVHYGFICDGCEMDPLVGDRYKCNYCEDFDFCSKCFDKRLTLGHNPFHGFTCYKYPRRPVGCCASTQFTAANSGSDKDTMTPTYPLEEKSVGDAPVTPPTKSVGTLPERQATRDESVQWADMQHCAFAGPWGSMDIFVDGPTMAAKVARACTAATEALTQQPSAPVVKEDNSTVDAGVNWGIECDLCGELPIVGPRYKCTICPDYDLCEKCYGFTSPSKSHEHLKDSFRKLSPQETIDIRKNPEIWAARCQPPKGAPTVAVPTEAMAEEPEACSEPTFGPIVLIPSEPEVAGAVDSTHDNRSAMESEIDEEIEMEEPPVESTDDDSNSSASESSSESWMDLGEMDNIEDDILFVGTPRSEQFQVTESVEGHMLDDDAAAEVHKTEDSSIARDRLVEALVEHEVVEDRARAGLLINQITSSEELRGMLRSLLSETQ
ncbi:hypothetical protein Pmar_PMAR025881 [Perkinsus marinus ATCC 50983]|uniref:ZZ-type domain-containing protein n=1 Tax=Perkinsus marinus (strain ATCC 50983 / TXsc) TaxID=423536 RepID=C5LUZ1_PERM5|nr:hypothetical protein Pmar_PMAR025881 [Perkinsus marinus ATCC 50983]EEQ99491.1 hypothetical protein Pmar_PMAR025881 [Perkinsus marinus ATCC 50983]|eukprot:XP_002766774.1 hypothetical protein Pmar_PMAR025881 [Perkinsus marinus ATCC 50983]